MALKHKYVIAYKILLNGEEIGDAEAEVQSAQPIYLNSDEQLLKTLIADTQVNLTVQIERATFLGVTDGTEVA